MKKGKYVRGTRLNLSPTLSELYGERDSLSIADQGGFVKRWLPIILIVILTALVYSFSFDNQATNWDDDTYTENNPLLKSLDKETVVRMFASDDPEELYFMGNYHPLTMLSLNISYHFSDLMPNGRVYPIRFIVVNVIMHLISCVILYMIFSLLFRNRLYPILIALLFGIHTLHVESVSWISERKDVLYTMFYLLSLYLYILYRRKQNVMFYILSLIVFIFSAFSKGQAVSLTITLFLIDYLILENYLDWKKHLNKIPFFIISIIFGLISIKAQAASTALSETDQYEFYQRIAFGSNGFLQYIYRFILPLKLANLYPYPDIINRTVPVLYWLTVPVFVIAILVNLLTFRKNKIFTFGLLFFIVNIALLLQFIPVGSAMYADRYAYIPSIGLSVLLVYCLDLLIKKFEKYRNVFYIMFSIYTLLLCYLTVNRVQIWHDSQSLWSDCVEKYPESVIGWNNLGSYYNAVADSLYKKTDHSKFIEYKKSAIECYTNGIKYKPDYVNCFFNRGGSWKDIYEINKDTSYFNKAMSDFDAAIYFNLSFSPAFHNRAVLWDYRLEQFLGVDKDSVNYYFSKAISDYNRAIELEPESVDLYLNRGTIYGKTGDFARSIEDFNVYAAKNPNSPSLLSNMGLAYNGLKKYTDAINCFNQALETDPSMESCYFNRALTYRNLGDSLSDKKYYQLAVDDMTKCITFSPNPVYYYYRGVYNQLMNNRGGACDDFHEAYNNNYKPAEYFIKNYCGGK